MYNLFLAIFIAFDSLTKCLFKVLNIYIPAGATVLSLRLLMMTKDSRHIIFICILHGVASVKVIVERGPQIFQ